MNKGNRQRTGTPTLISLIPFLWGGKGHMLTYHQAVGRAAHRAGWNHVTLYPISESFTDIPEDWLQCLDVGALESPGFRKFTLIPLFIDIIQFSRSITSNLIDIAASTRGDRILFVERFNPYQLASIFLSLRSVSQADLYLWLLFRHSPGSLPRYRLLYRTQVWLLRRLLKDNLVLLTDSEILKDSLSGFFRLPVDVVPVPHTVGPKKTAHHKRSSATVCWWAGPPRDAKGWEVMKKLMTLTGPHAKQITIVAAKSSSLFGLPNGIRSRLIDDTLPPSRYTQQLLATDIVLLPYQPRYYREETSGIFIECVVAGKIPLVTADTWMAYELGRNNLSELIVNWNDPNLISFLISIARRTDVRRRLDSMRKKYSQYHNENNYAAVMAAVYGHRHGGG